VEGLEDDLDLVNGAYEHFSQAFQTALVGYFDCVADADFDSQDNSNHVHFLYERAAFEPTPFRISSSKPQTSFGSEL
jgi:uncharacterized Zn finger protein